jgi:membrane associated rhomboid family serine protease
MDRSAMDKYMFHPYSIKRNREHYRFLTHAFIHGSYIHLAFNCIGLYSFGLAIEEFFFPLLFGPKLGKVYYLILFTGGIYASSFTEYFRNKDNPSYSSLGASGAISSIMFSYIMISPLSEMRLFTIELQGWIFGILLLGVSYYLIRRKKTTDYDDNISHESHFWGALFGVALMLILKHDILEQFILQIKKYFS